MLRLFSARGLCYCAWISVLIGTVAMSEPPLQDIDAVKCPSNKRYKCPKSGKCHDLYQYCYDGSAEPCISETILNVNESRREYCSRILQGEEPTDVRDNACDMKTACYSEFGSQFEKDCSCFLPVVYAISIALVVLVILIIVGGLICWKKIKKICERQKSPDSEHELEISTNRTVPPIPVEQTRRIENEVENENENNHATESDANESTDVHRPLILRQTRDAGYDINSPADSGVSEPSTLNNTPNSGEVGSIASSSDSYQRENQLTDLQNNSYTDLQNNSYNGKNGAIHPADIESRQHRAIHMPSTEQSNDNMDKVVTSKSMYSGRE